MAEYPTLDFVKDSERLHWQMDRWTQAEFELAKKEFMKRAKNKTLRTIFFNPLNKKVMEAIDFPFGVRMKGRTWCLAGNLVLSCEE